MRNFSELHFCFPGFCSAEAGNKLTGGLTAEQHHLLVEESMGAGITLQMQSLAFGLAAAEKMSSE